MYCFCLFVCSFFNQHKRCWNCNTCLCHMIKLYIRVCVWKCIKHVQRISWHIFTFPILHRLPIFNMYTHTHSLAGHFNRNTRAPVQLCNYEIISRSRGGGVKTWNRVETGHELQLTAENHLLESRSFEVDELRQQI